MLEGYYSKPKNKIKINRKKLIVNPVVACIMPVYVGEAARTEYPVLNEDLIVQEHYIEDKLESIKTTLKLYNKFKTNIRYEIILVDNGTTDEKSLEYYKTLPYRILRRKNEGFSFGAWKHAWESLKDKYDYYLFHEADYAPIKDYWLEELIDEFNKDNKIGAIGNVLETRGLPDAKAPIPIKTIEPQKTIKEMLVAVETDRKWMCNFDGCYTFTSRIVLEQIDNNGGLFVGECSGGKRADQQKNASLNEIRFQQPFMELGYKIAAFGSPDFHETDRIYFYGIRSGNLSRDFNEKKLVPIVNVNTRNTCKQVKYYYDGLFK